VSTELQAGDPVATRRRIRDGMERRHLESVVTTFAPDVVLHSPIILGRSFEGRTAVALVIAAVMETFEALEYTVEADAGDVQVLAFRARVRGVDIDGVDLLRVDDRGLVNEITVHIRPLPGLAAVAAELGPPLARGQVQRMFVIAFAVPLFYMLRFADRLIPRLARMR
jgi:hypothetical protein